MGLCGSKEEVSSPEFAPVGGNIKKGKKKKKVKKSRNVPASATTNPISPAHVENPSTAEKNEETSGFSSQQCVLEVKTIPEVQPPVLQSDPKQQRQANQQEEDLSSISSKTGSSVQAKEASTVPQGRCDTEDGLADHISHPSQQSKKVQPSSEVEPKQSIKTDLTVDVLLTRRSGGRKQSRARVEEWLTDVKMKNGTDDDRLAQSVHSEELERAMSVQSDRSSRLGSSKPKVHDGLTAFGLRDEAEQEAEEHTSVKDSEWMYNLDELNKEYEEKRKNSGAATPQSRQFASPNRVSPAARQ